MGGHGADVSIGMYDFITAANQKREMEITQQVSALMNDPTVRKLFDDLRQLYSPKGVVEEGKGIIKIYE